MTITTRSRRATSFSCVNTPVAVGPGSYAPEQAGEQNFHPRFESYIMVYVREYIFDI